MKRLKMLQGYVLLIVIWYVLSIVIGTNLVPYPHLVLTYLFKRILTGEILLHVLHSLYRLVIALGVSLIIGVPIGLSIAMNNRYVSWLRPLNYLMYPIPKIAFLPIFMVLFGIGDLSKIILLFSVLIFQIIISTMDSIDSIPKRYREVSTHLELSTKEKIKKLYLPYALPNIFSAMRISIGISMAVLFFAENYATEYGLGYYIMNNWMMVNYKGMYAGVVVLSLVAGLLIYFIEKIKKRVCHWV